MSEVKQALTFFHTEAREHEARAQLHATQQEILAFQ